MSVFNNLIQIARTHKARLVGTFSLVLAENLLLVTYPVLGGFAINGVLEGNLWKALGYAGVVLVMWTVGSARRAVDTRTFTRIYAEMVVPVILRQRADGERVSTISARAALSRELVDFFEQHLPTLLTSTITVLGAVVMLLIIEFWSGVTSLVILLVFMGVVPRYSRVNDRLYFRLNNRLERDVHVIEHYDSRLLTKHYGLLSRLRVKISNREAISYAVIGVTLAMLFGITLGMLTLRGHADAGHLYAVVSYLWSFAMSIDDAPHLLEEFSKIRDISERVRVED
ncbi:hypothetical protein EHV23_09555 [Lautropia dentalis]|uniref:ABC transmembrane type-1 domain-containing protein n=1 Tax=Lautropia dentalis TaxID=2490857 RepID=A0A426FLI2_9BURK|nr:ABC transporter six-transmembrane domain-containing protein [Lautropia dentalis]RRN43666.1 hypothetical protein EHV23_09555 [Lautropia dentalis]